jgi:hypothetical protein
MTVYDVCLGNAVGKNISSIDCERNRANKPNSPGAKAETETCLVLVGLLRRAENS